MTTKHTPGPWTAYKTEKGWGVRADFLFQPPIGEPLSSSAYLTFPNLEQRSAVLIAAAPDMLAALHMLESRHASGIENLAPQRCECVDCQVIRAAITKAEGR